MSSPAMASCPCIAAQKSAVCSRALRLSTAAPSRSLRYATHARSTHARSTAARARCGSCAAVRVRARACACVRVRVPSALCPGGAIVHARACSCGRGRAEAHSSRTQPSAPLRAAAASGV
eukprot:7298166-Prymnesium_polylepis.2